ncbi:MAG: NAD-dependent epimerase/dehydratase family protein [Microscillaceae bacterium]|nr:NAD-dependent epimerase/dehydratase family protein [Microscillaceae bacterium]
MNKVLITGSSSRIGRALHWILCQDYDVVGIDISPSSATSKIVDIRDYEQLLRCFEGIDTIFHSAALHAPITLLKSKRKKTKNIVAPAFPIQINQFEIIKLNR